MIFSISEVDFLKNGSGLGQKFAFPFWFLMPCSGRVWNLMHHLAADDRIEGGIRKGELLDFCLRSEDLFQSLILQWLDKLPQPTEGDPRGWARTSAL